MKTAGKLNAFNFEQAALALKSKLILPNPLKDWSGASIDTRTLRAGDVFFALRGNHQDGHDHLWEAFRRGASGAVIRKDYLKKTREQIFRERSLFHNLIPVTDPEAALQALSARVRSGFSAVGLGVTGSVGKTSTKEFLGFLLSQKYPVLSSRGNYNNHLGLPLTLFQLKPEHLYCVAELGASRRGEIRKLSSLLKPRVGIITGVSAAHLEGFGSLDSVYEAKLELADALAQQKGTLILPDWDPELLKRARRRKLPLLLFGKNRTSDFYLSRVRSEDGWVTFEVNDRWEFKFPGYASFQAENALAALAACFAAGIAPGEWPSVWKEIEFPKGRFEVFSPREGVRFINDCYNANPYSFEKSLEAFEAVEGSGRKILVLGDMLELGSQSLDYHRRLGKSIREKKFQGLLTVGHWMREAALICEKEGNPPLVLHFEDKGMLSHFLANFLKPGDQVLFKGSRAIKLEEVIGALLPAVSAQRLSHSL